MVSIVLPAFNEAYSIEQVIENIRSVMDKSKYNEYEIIVVDDASKDNTSVKASKTKVVKNLTNKGYGYSIKQGIDAASFDTIVTLDADGTYDVSAIPKLLERYNQGYDLVIGSRKGKFYRENIKKNFLRFILKLIVEFISREAIPDINSGFRVFSKKTIKPFFPRLCDTFSFSSSLTLAYLMTAKHVLHIPTEYFKRVGNSKVRLFADSIRTIQFICQAALYYDPLRIFTFLAFLILIFSSVAVIISMIFQIASGFLLAVGGIIAAVIVFAMGLLGNLLQQIMHGE